MAADQATVELDGHRFSLTNLRKVLYPATGTTKADVIGYFAEVAHVMIPHVLDRPVTRKRWPNGVDTTPFFHKDLPRGTPTWVTRRVIEHSDGPKEYPIVDSPATLAWLGQIAALELHVPQWRFDPDGAVGPPDRLVFDLDPGPGVGLAQCAEVALAVRARLDGTVVIPVTSGSKGIHLYSHLDGTLTSDDASLLAKEIAEAIEQDMPRLVVSRMAKSLRPGKVFIDWSQNNGSKTTIAPYSLRGREQPCVAAPRTWEELADPELRNLDYREVLELLERGPDPMAGLETGDAVEAEHRTLRRRAGGGRSKGAARPAGEAEGAKLDTYRAKRSATRTPEPVPGPGPLPRGNDDTFVIQEHHARRLHYDFRLERDGVLVSWAVPRGIPDTPAQNRLAVQTEDHPLEYASFAGTIPMGEYGGGTVTIWDAGTYVTEKWRPGEVIVVLDGARARGRFALIRTEADQWLMKRMKDQSPPSTAADGAIAFDPDRANTDRPEAESANTDRSEAEPAQSDQTVGVGASAARGTSSIHPASAAANLAPAPAPDSPRPPHPPTDLRPMLATPGTLADLGDDGVWRLEGKWDGIRALAALGSEELRLTSRTGNDFTYTYPELAELNELLDGHSVVLDGEIVALTGDGRTSFSLLQQRMNLAAAKDVARVRRKVAVEYWVFDVLYLDGVSLLGKRLDDRRRILEALPLFGRACSVPDLLPADPREALRLSEDRGWEGVVAKRGDSTYQAGRRSRSWIKIKNFRTVEVVVVGWRPGAGRRAGGVGSLLVAVPASPGPSGPERDSADLRYAGRVGTGFTDAMLDDLLEMLKPLRRRDSPVAETVPAVDARDAVWVEPTLVGEVRYVEWTPERRLRAPSWRGLRPDKTTTDLRPPD